MNGAALPSLVSQISPATEAKDKVTFPGILVVSPVWLLPFGLWQLQPLSRARKRLV